MNNIYIYDNNFISLLNLVNELIKKNIKPDDIKPEYYNPTLLDEVIYLKVPNNSDILNFIYTNWGNRIFNTIYYVFLSNHENKELIIYYFILNAYKYQKNIVYHRDLRCVTLALKIAHQVGNEAHRLKGFIRFKELENHILYSTIAPDNDVLYLLSLHFKRRLKAEYWIIKDEKRDLISIYDKKEFYIIEGQNFQMAQLKESTNEKEMQNLWQTFYKTIAIKQRHNERCRMNFMPKKYWKYILEVREEL